MHSQNRDIFPVNAVPSIPILFILRSDFHLFVACCSLGINILLQHTRIRVDSQIYNENTHTFK